MTEEELDRLERDLVDYKQSEDAWDVPGTALRAIKWLRLQMSKIPAHARVSRAISIKNACDLIAVIRESAEAYDRSKREIYESWRPQTLMSAEPSFGSQALNERLEKLHEEMQREWERLRIRVVLAVEDLRQQIPSEPQTKILFVDIGGPRLSGPDPLGSICDELAKLVALVDRAPERG